MKKLIELIRSYNLLNLDQEALNRIKKQEPPYLTDDNIKLYKTSLYNQKGVLFCMAMVDLAKSLFLVSGTPLESDFTGTIEKIDEFFIQSVAMTPGNAIVLQKLFPFTAPVSLRHIKTTLGCGDRLGLATAGHIRAAREYDLHPVLAQQSIRELNFTGRTYKDVTADTAFQVFQEGFEKGYGADGDHLKTIADIDTALAAGMPMITLDLSEVMLAEAADWNEQKVTGTFNVLPEEEKKRILAAYANKGFSAGEKTITMTVPEVMRCTVMYKQALDFAEKVDNHLRSHRGDRYDLEISIDETTTPTLPSHHLYIIRELNHRQVTVNSLAPRFIGEFQKAIDYIGDKNEFEKQFAVHCAIAGDNGGYKISVHSGSDKFSVYPVVGRYTDMRLHLKTAGTSWLEAVRCIAACNPVLYRRMHKQAFIEYEHASKFYHITADLSRIRDINQVADDKLPEYLEENESRQLIHITYGGLLNNPEIRQDFFRTLAEFEDTHYSYIKRHFVRHIEQLGVPRLQGT